ERAGDELHAERAQAASRLGHLAVEADIGPDGKLARIVAARRDIETVAGGKGSRIFRRLEIPAVNLAVDPEQRALPRDKGGGVVETRAVLPFRLRAALREAEHDIHARPTR